MLDIFTIVLNGMPFVTEHKAILSKLTIPWRWHIVEGVALPEKCTGWCQPIRPEDHKNWLSNDGTTEYLDSIKGDDILVYRNSEGPWHGKLDMCNAVLPNLSTGAILHEMDVDEFWSPGQLETIHKLFTEGGAGRAWYYCDYYLGPDVHVTTNTRPANAEAEAWIRTHRYVGKPWAAHEPPALYFEGRDVKHAETAALGLVFKHFAYATEAQVRFKENYYRYTGAVDQWRHLQKAAMPTNPGFYLRWVNPMFNAVVDRTEPYPSVIKKLQA